MIYNDVLLLLSLVVQAFGVLPCHTLYCALTGQSASRSICETLRQTDVQHTGRYQIPPQRASGKGEESNKHLAQQRSRLEHISLCTAQHAGSLGNGAFTIQCALILC